MSRYIFLFDLDSTITRQEIFPRVAELRNLHGQIMQIAESTLCGEIPFKQSLIQRIELLKEIPVREASEAIEQIDLNEGLAEFIARNRDRCYIVTGHLDVWIGGLMKKMGMEGNVFASKALTEDGYIRDVFSVLDKNAVISQMVLPFVAVGDGNNDADMIAAAEVGIGYGGVREIAPAVLECASHAVYEEEKLVDFLNRLL